MSAPMAGHRDAWEAKRNGPYRQTAGQINGNHVLGRQTGAYFFNTPGAFLKDTNRALLGTVEEFDECLRCVGLNTICPPIERQPPVGFASCLLINKHEGTHIMAFRCERV